MDDYKQFTAPSADALKELNQPAYLRGCDVTARTTIRDATITYEVVVGGWFVWCKVGQFGTSKAHRAGGAAFVGLAQEQEKVMHEWADKILSVQEGN